VWILC
jgi:formylglycine-generating enzyme required for sulfatase activity